MSYYGSDPYYSGGQQPGQPAPGDQPAYGGQPSPYGQPDPYSQPDPYGQADPYGQSSANPTYEQPGFTQPAGTPGYGQDPYGQPMSGAPGYGPDPFAPPPPGVPPPGWQPPAPQKSGATGGLIAGIIGIVLVLLIGVGAVVYFVAFGDDADPSPNNDPSFSTSEARPTDLFPETLTGGWMDLGLIWNLVESGAFDCDQVGTSEVTAVLIAQGCEEVHVASYVDASEQYAVTVGVIEYADVATADAAEYALNDVLPPGWTSSPRAMDSVFYFLTPDGSGITSDTRVQGSRDAYENYLLYTLCAGYDGSNGEQYPAWDVEFGVADVLGVTINDN